MSANSDTATVERARFELRWLQSGGAPVWLQLDLASLVLPGGDCWMVHWQDIDIHKQAELALVRMAHFHSQTGLINRAWLLELGALACAESALPPAKLELTESYLMTDPDGCSEALHELRALDVSISVDDFGAGYSSFAYVKPHRAPPAELRPILMGPLAAVGTEQN
ncbi:EAL domain-containing protein [Paucibacter sp. AS339]|uniref:EAL domain-containing protein n=1 Tax=Paucibacter hankyongi TaxID=3133434 RepID=UPI0030AF1041